LTFDDSTGLCYRRSKKPLAIDQWSDALPMAGKHEAGVAHPAFVLPRQNHPLTLFYRDGVGNEGCARLKTYDEANHRWVDLPIAILSGAKEAPWACNAYWNHPASGDDGSLHLSFVWRSISTGNQEGVNNINIGYAWSSDNGLTWATSKGRSYELPITPVSSETVFPVSPGSNLAHQTSMALDSQKRPHIVFYADDENSIPQYQHLWFDGRKWQHQIISQRTRPFCLEERGTLRSPIGRPEIVVDRQGSVFVVYRGDCTDNRLVAQKLCPPSYHVLPIHVTQLWDEDLGYAEPVIDRSRWSRDQILTVQVQSNQQADGGRNDLPKTSTVNLVDIQFST